MIGETTGIEKSVFCTAAVLANTIAIFGANDDTMSTATAVSEELVGVFQHAQPVAGGEVRVALSGVARVKIAGNVTRGNWVTTNASGQGVAAAPAVGVNNSVIGRAMASGVSGDIIPVFISFDRIQG